MLEFYIKKSRDINNFCLLKLIATNKKFQFNINFVFLFKSLSLSLSLIFLQKENFPRNFQ